MSPLKLEHAAHWSDNWRDCSARLSQSLLRKHQNHCTAHLPLPLCSTNQRSILQFDVFAVMGKGVTNKSAGLRRALTGYALFCSHVAKQGVEYPPEKRFHMKATPNKREIVRQRWTFGCMCTLSFCVSMYGFTDVDRLVHSILCLTGLLQVNLSLQHQSFMGFGWFRPGELVDRC